MEAGMDALVVWAFLALVQVQGGISEVYDSKETCEAGRQKLLSEAPVLLISACVETKLDKP
jgi:hypothetical protein